MQCYQCGAMVPPNSRRCPNCGAPLDGNNAYQSERDDRQGRGRDEQGRNGSRRSGRSSSNNTGNDTPGSDRSERGDNRSRPRPDPLNDPRAPGFLRNAAPSSRRDDFSADNNYRDAGGRGRGAGAAGGDNRPPNPRGDPRADRDGRDRGRAGGGGKPLAPLSPPSPSPQRRESGYADYYDDSPSMEMSAEYSAEYSAEFSAEYPDPRGYNQRDYDQRPPAPASRNDERGGRYENPRDRRRGAYQEPPQPPRANSWGQQAAADGWETDSAAWDAPLSEEYAAYQPQGRTRGARPAKASRKTSSRRGPIFLFGTLLVVALIAIAGGVLLGPSLLSRIKNGPAVSDNAPPFVTYTPGPTPAPPANYKEFANAHAFYVLDYPQSWSISNSTTPIDGQYDYVDQFTRTTPQANFIIEQAGAFSSLTRADIIKAEVQGGESNRRTFAQISSPTATMEIGGEQWVRNDYLVTQQDGSKLHMAIIACHHHQAGYAIVLVSLPDNFAQDSQSAFEPILNTFHFTN